MGTKTDSRASGFTLLELLIGIAVLAILVTIAVPSLSDLIKSNRVTGQTNELVSIINFARNEAIRRNENIPVVLTSTADGWSGEVRDPSGDGAESCTAQGALRCADYRDVQLSQDIDNTSDTATMTFNSRGYLTPFSPVNIDLEHDDCRNSRHRRTISILPTGQVSSVETACSG